MILLQVPDGLKRKVLEIADKYEDVVISGESCFGACDLRLSEAKELGCEKIVHYGHNKFMDTDTNVEYVEMREKLKIPDFDLDFQRIGLVSSLQFLDLLEDVKEKLKGKDVVIGGHILGCDVSNAKKIEDEVECFLSVGSGRFHGLGVALATEKPVFVLDLERGKVEEFDKTLFLKQRYAAQALFKDAKKIGILVSTKPGQMKMDLAKKIKKELKDKKCYIFVFDEIKPEKLEWLDLDGYVNTACPRIGIEDRTNFKKPLLNVNELDLYNKASK